MSETPQTLAVESQTPVAEDKWLLRLYVAGRSPKCVTALENLKRFCEERMAGRYGNDRVTTRNLSVVEVRSDKNLILVRGAVAGPRGGYVIVRPVGGVEQ